MTFDFHSHAKINLFLKVLGKTNAGYHEISSLILPLNFADKLTIKSEAVSSSKIKIIASLSEDLKLHLFDSRKEFKNLLESESSLLNIASKHFFKKLKEIKGNIDYEFDAASHNTEKRENLVFNLAKNIPPEAGLGGGSSNAAWVLEALNLKYGNLLTRSDLLNLAQNIGCDVSAQLFAEACYVQGRGEDVTHIKFDPPSLEFLGKLRVVLIKPPFGSPTQKAFEELNAKPIRVSDDLESIRLRTKLVKLNFLNCTNEDLINQKKLKISDKLFFDSIENDFDLKFKLQNENHCNLKEPPVSAGELYSLVESSLSILKRSNMIKNRFAHLLAGSGSTRAVILESDEDSNFFADYINNMLPSSFLIVKTGFEISRFL